MQTTSIEFRLIDRTYHHKCGAPARPMWEGNQLVGMTCRDHPDVVVKPASAIRPL